MCNDRTIFFRTLRTSLGAFKCGDQQAKNMDADWSSLMQSIVGEKNKFSVLIHKTENVIKTNKYIWNF